MANTYYDSQLTAAEIEAALEAIDGVIVPANNGKVLAINNGKLEARSVQWGGGGASIEPLSVTQNGTYTAPSGVDGYSPVTVNVSGGGGSSFVTPDYQGFSYGYLGRSGVEFFSNTTNANYIQVFPVLANHKYALFVGETVGNRRRAALYENKTIADFITYIETPSTETLIYSNGIWLAPFTPGYDDSGDALVGRIICSPTSDGVVVYGTDNAGTAAKAYCVEIPN